MAFDARRDAEQVRCGERLAEQGVAGQDAADRRGGRRAEAARERDLVVHLDPPADALRQRAADLSQDRFETQHEPVRPVPGEFFGALAVDRQLDRAAAPAADFEIDPVEDRERQAKAVVARPEIGRRRRHLDRDPPAVEFGEPVHHQPRAAAMPSADDGASRIGGTIVSAVCGSLRPARSGRRRCSRLDPYARRRRACGCRPPTHPTTARRRCPRGGRGRGTPRGSRRRSPPR